VAQGKICRRSERSRPTKRRFSSRERSRSAGGVPRSGVSTRVEGASSRMIVAQKQQLFRCVRFMKPARAPAIIPFPHAKARAANE
jgi:hypothetical protein